MFSPRTADVCEPLQKLTSIETNWTWNRMYQENSEKGASMRSYDMARPLYLETNASNISLGARLLQAGDGMNCRCGKITDNAILYLTAFTMKNHVVSSITTATLNMRLLEFYMD